MDYEDAEQAGRDRQDTDGNPTLAQWARAEALRAVLASPMGALRMDDISDRVNAFAAMIVEGSVPKPPPGVSW